MAIQHLKHGEDFGAQHFGKDFGFSGSAQGYDGHPTAPPFAGSSPTNGGKHESAPMEVGGGSYAHGGMTHGHHPHGHEPVGEMKPLAMGGMCQHHAHGGHTVHHADGRMTHHHADGSPVRHHAMARGGGVEGMHDSEGEYVHRGHGAPTFGTEDHQSVGGEFEPIHPDSPDTTAPHHTEGYARGGFAGHRASLPRDMKPMAERHHSPIDTPPRNPNTTKTPRNAMPGGQMAMGVQPSSEPDQAGADQGIPQMRHGGGHHKRK